MKPSVEKSGAAKPSDAFGKPTDPKKRRFDVGGRARGSPIILIFVCALGLAVAFARAPDAQIENRSTDETPPYGLEVEVSRHYLTLTTTFKGDELIVFGVAKNASDADLVIVIEGPTKTLSLYEKRRYFGIWYDQKRHTYPGIPGFWYLVSSRPLDDLLSKEKLVENRIGLDAYLSGSLDDEAHLLFREALDEMKRRELVVAGESVLWRKGDLFRADLTMPADVSEGLYEVRALIVKGGQVETAASTSFWINKEGFTAWITSVSRNRPLLLGLSWALITLLTGMAFAGLRRLRRRF